MSPAETGTVRVPELFTVERYRTVWQMTSTVSARVAAELGFTDLLRALFPSGSVTGAPKISTMEVIARLEASPREVYCGAIGFVEPGGDCTFNVPIRTAWIDTHAGEASPGIPPRPPNSTNCSPRPPCCASTGRRSS